MTLMISSLKLKKITHEQTTIHISETSRQEKTITNIFRPQPHGIETVILSIKILREATIAGSVCIAFRFIRGGLPAIPYHLS